MSISSKIIGPFTTVDYSSMIITNYERKNPKNGSYIMRIPFVGLKILMIDNDAAIGTGESRIKYLEQYIGKVLENSGCFLRETNNKLMPYGFWLISLPVPVSQLNKGGSDQMGRVIQAMYDLERKFNITFAGKVEINVSGRCTVADTETALSNILIPDSDYEFLLRPKHSAYSIGNVVRINDIYMLLRTSWDLSNFGANYEDLGGKIHQLAYNISPIFR